MLPTLPLPALIGERIKAFRAEAQLSQQQLASASGLSVSIISKLEQGAISSPGITTLLSIAVALQIDLTDLLEG